MNLRYLLRIVLMLTLVVIGRLARDVDQRKPSQLSELLLPQPATGSVITAPAKPAAVLTPVTHVSTTTTVVAPATAGWQFN